ncbi:short-chain dehydrogenase [Lentinula aff. detonsa]|uniref:Short-chain dehydrogenase n=1 Tax=Lentinula aff. detonsa TaxID=2804958 RepID=A0AA38KC59_9AGAR|nr:short-chain dehydrogenase [Lentinula aff. detonsa]KAJ3795011.1 short-chain dehydrogenase [Lentinula aff. detonsa]
MIQTIRSPIYDPTSSLPDLTGKVALVTGSNSPIGIGWNIANQLALKGAKVYVHGRTLEKARAGIAAILRQGSDLSNTRKVAVNQLEPFVVDLGDLKAVRDTAVTFVEKEARLDILVHNAMALAYDSELDEYGISPSMTINHLAPFLLTMELLPLLKSTAQSHPGVRIVTLSSIAHTFINTSDNVRYDSLSSFNDDLGERADVLKRYAYSKLANVLFAKELQRKLDEAGIQAISVSVHPGGVKTDGSMKYFGPDKLSVLDGALSPLQGALAPLFAAAATEVWTQRDGGRDKLKSWTGAYVMPYGVPSPVDESEAAKDPKLAKELWETTEKILAENVGISVSF